MTLYINITASIIKMSVWLITNVVHNNGKELKKDTYTGLNFIIQPQNAAI